MLRVKFEGGISTIALLERIREVINKRIQEKKKNIRVRDRATLFNLLIGLNGYTVCSGVIDRELNGSDIIAVPLKGEGSMHIGYIMHKKIVPSRLAAIYLEALKRYI